MKHDSLSQRVFKPFSWRQCQGLANQWHRWAALLASCRQYWAFVSVWLCLCLATEGNLRAEHSTDEFFETAIRPLLAEHCWECHGSSKQWNGLRLDSAQALAHGGDSGPAIVPGHPEQSLLYQVVSGGGDIEMPPEKPLSKTQMEALRRWIEMGSPWPDDSAALPSPEAWKSHWAFQPLSHPMPPPVVDSSQQQRNAIDSLIAKELAQHNLQPAPYANRRALLRRASYALTGLPPTAEEVERFTNDDQEDAYEQLIDRLLASPAFGQHLARLWLDVALLDTKGYVYAREERFYVHSALYRDWVVDAINSDMPYDQFIQINRRHQLATDDPKALARWAFNWEAIPGRDS